MLASIDIGRAFSVLMKTLPILGIRLAYSLIAFVLFIIYMLIVFGLAALVANISEVIGVILFIVAMVALAPIYNLAYRYIFYILKAAHIAVIAELLQNDKLPDGVNQLEWGKQQVQQRFGEVSVMFVVDELVNGVVRAFTNTLEWLTAWIPGGALQQLIEMVKMVIRLAVGYVDEAIIARAFWMRSESIWATAIDGVVLYTQIWKAILVNAVVLMVLSYIPFVLVLIIFSAPVAAVLNAFNPDLAAWAIIAAMFLGYLVKVSVGDTFAMIAIIAAYQKQTQGLEPNPEMKAKLEGISDKFRDLQQRAAQELGNLTRSGEKPKTDAPPAPSSATT
jgi:hypothetical protein